MDNIPPTRQTFEEALGLSGEILRNIELNEISLGSIALKACRLARLLNEFDFQKIMELEAGGYPRPPEGISPEVWVYATTANRVFRQKVFGSDEIKDYAYTESIGALEARLRISEMALAAARDPDVSLSSANPYQIVSSPSGNVTERYSLRQDFELTGQKLASRRTFIYQYALSKHYELKTSGISDDIFTRIRLKVDSAIGQHIPDAVQRLTASYENLRSENPEDWSNAVHSCRRILQDLADALFPPSDEIRTTKFEGKVREIKMGKDNYINRIMAFVEGRSSSERYQNLVGSHLGFLGDRLDSVFQAAQKGSHSTIVSREEADRYVVYTYLLVGDIVSLLESDDAC